jgi:hypothetical protein
MPEELSKDEASQKAVDYIRKPIRDAVFTNIYNRALIGKESCKFFIDYEVEIHNEEEGLFECKKTKWLEDVLDEKEYKWKFLREPARVYGWNYFYKITWELDEKVKEDLSKVKSSDVASPSDKTSEGEDKEKEEDSLSREE